MCKGLKSLLAIAAMIFSCVAVFSRGEETSDLRGDASGRKSLLVESFPSEDERTVSTTFFLDARFKGFTLVDHSGQERPCRVMERRGSRIAIRFNALSGEKLTLHCLREESMPEGTPPLLSGLLHRVRTYDGTAINSLTAFSEAWKKGRDERSRFEENIFLGFNPLGDGKGTLHSFDGILTVDKPGNTIFCTASTDASFLLVDGKPVAEWPGSHPVHPGLKGEKRGGIVLTRGVHRLTYLHANNRTPLFQIAAWIPPGEKSHRVISPAAFTPAAYARVGPLTDRHGKPLPDFIWEQKGLFSSVGSGIHDYLFEAPDREDVESYTWIFRDGSRREGRKIRHIFFTRGPQTVKLLLRKRGSGEIGRAAQEVDIFPLHGYSENNDALTLGLIRRAILQEREARIEPEGYPILAESLLFFLKEEEAASFTERFLAAIDRIPPKLSIPVLNRLALALQSGRERYALAERCLGEVLARAGEGEERRRACLNYAELLIHALNRPAEALALLETLDPERLGGDERRRHALYRADAALVLKDIATARECYARIPPLSTLTNGSRESLFTKSSRSFRIRHLISRGAYRDAREAIEKREWEDPSLRLSPALSLLKIQALAGDNRPERAIVCALRALAAESDPALVPKFRLALAKLFRQGGQLLRSRRQLILLRKESPSSPEEVEARKLLEQVNREIKGGSR